MPNNSFSDAQIKALQELKDARDRKEGDPSWVDDLGEKPDAPVGDGGIGEGVAVGGTGVKVSSGCEVVQAKTNISPNSRNSAFFIVFS